MAFGSLSTAATGQSWLDPADARLAASSVTIEKALRATNPLAGGVADSRIDTPLGDGSSSDIGPPSMDSLDTGDAESDTERANLASTQTGPTPVFVPYVVQPGDTVSEIAARFGISTDYVVWNNVNVIEDADSLAIGATLQIPGVEGIIHSARVGDTVSELAVAYDSTTEAIVNFEANGFAGDPNNLPVGALILLPGGRPIPPEPAADASNGPAWTPPPLEAVGTWVWPAVGRLTNVFGPRHPMGIDISMVVNTPIAAASSGQVTFVGGNPCCSYGYHVIVEHADGLETLYAHLNEAYVSVGTWVSTGDIIAASGNTGYSTGPHLHFEVRKNGIYSNPLGYLP